MGLAIGKGGNSVSKVQIESEAHHGGYGRIFSAAAFFRACISRAPVRPRITDGFDDQRGGHADTKRKKHHVTARICCTRMRPRHHGLRTDRPPASDCAAPEFGSRPLHNGIGAPSALDSGGQRLRMAEKMVPHYARRTLVRHWGHAPRVPTAATRRIHLLPPFEGGL